MKQLLEKLFEFLHLSFFSAIEIKKLVLVGKILRLFDVNIACKVNSFVASSDITVLINIFKEILKILHMLKAINLY